MDAPGYRSPCPYAFFDILGAVTLAVDDLGILFLRKPCGFINHRTFFLVERFIHRGQFGKQTRLEDAQFTGDFRWGLGNFGGVSPPAEIALVLVRFDHVACRIVNTNHGIIVSGWEVRKR